MFISLELLGFLEEFITTTKGSINLKPDITALRNYYQKGVQPDLK